MSKYTNKWTSKSKHTFLVRSSTSVLVVLYVTIFLGLSMLSTPRNPWFDLGATCKLRLGFVTILYLLPIIYLAYKEICDCCLKNSHKFTRYFLIIFNTLINLFFVCLLNLYVNQKALHIDFDNFTKSYLILFGLVEGFNLLLLYIFVCFSKNNISFNKKYFPLITLMISVAFTSFIYLTLFKFFTTFLFIILVTWITDSAAYLGGSIFGKHKMCPKISPNKTWEGFIISVILASLVLFLYIYLLHFDNHTNYLIFNLFGYHELGLSPPKLSVWIGIGFITVLLTLVNTCGDLTFSLIKRKNNIKDFSNLLPGHGGILDRIDALIFITVTFVFICGAVSICNDISLAYLFI